MMQKIQKFFSEKGQGIVEYGIVLAVVAAIAFAALGTDKAGLQNKVKAKFSAATDNIEKTGGAGT